MAELGSVLEYFRELNFASTLLRLTMAMLFGGLIGLERERKRRAAGFRTYMLVCLGAALAMLLGQYEELMITTNWAASLEGLVSRLTLPVSALRWSTASASLVPVPSS